MGFTGNGVLVTFGVPPEGVGTANGDIGDTSLLLCVCSVRRLSEPESVLDCGMGEGGEARERP